MISANEYSWENHQTNWKSYTLMILLVTLPVDNFYIIKNTWGQKCDWKHTDESQLSLLFLQTRFNIRQSFFPTFPCGNGPVCEISRLARWWHSGYSCEMMVNNIIYFNRKGGWIKHQHYTHTATRMSIRKCPRENAHLSKPHVKLCEQDNLSRFYKKKGHRN